MYTNMIRNLLIFRFFLGILIFRKGQEPLRKPVK